MKARQMIPALWILALCSPLVLALMDVDPRGTWPSDWPEELEPCRERAETARGPLGNDAAYYKIPFSDRSDFENAWPALLKVKTEGAPVTLRDTGSDSGTVWVKRWISPSRQSGLAIDLDVDGEIIDMNRIALPTDAPIIDERGSAPRPRRGSGVQACSPLPHGCSWKVHWDLTLDGRVEDGTTRTFRMDLANNQIRAYFTGEDSQHNTNDRWWHGEVVPGRTPLIVLRRDDVGGYVASHLLHQAAPGHFVGTWMDNLGHAGDIELTLQDER